jgi:serine/threonine-protein kinase
MSSEEKRQLPSTDEAIFLASRSPNVEELAGTILLDRYRLVELQGCGGASAVYRAEHTLMAKPVAVKILRPELVVRQDFVQRFLAEARTVAKLRHEHIVDIVDIGRTESGLVFCVMEYLEGEDLGETIAREGKLPWLRARDIVVQVCEALAAAHAAGVVHRDIKSQNCFRIRRAGNSDFIKLLDFGIAKQIDQPEGLTQEGVVLATAEFCSPEQARGQVVDARSDIYSLGCMLFELLSGRPPFEADSFVEVLSMQISERPPRLSRLVPEVDESIDAIVDRALAKRPENRFQTVDELVEALGRVGEGTQKVFVPQPTVAPVQLAASSPISTDGPRHLRSVVVGSMVAIVGAVAAVAVYAVITADDPADVAGADESDAQAVVAAHGGAPATSEPAREPEVVPTPMPSAVDDAEPEPPPGPYIEIGDATLKPGDGAPENEPTDVAQAKPTSPPHGEEQPASPPASHTLSKTDRRKLERSLRDACATSVGFQARTVRVSVRPDKQPIVNVTPPYALLDACINKRIKTLPEGMYRLRFKMKSPGSG